MDDMSMGQSYKIDMFKPLCVQMVNIPQQPLPMCFEDALSERYVADIIFDLGYNRKKFCHVHCSYNWHPEITIAGK